MNRLAIFIFLLLFSKTALASDPTGLFNLFSIVALLITAIPFVITWAVTSNSKTTFKWFARSFVIMLFWAPTLNSSSYYPAFWVYILPEQGSVYWTLFSAFLLSCLASALGTLFVKYGKQPGETVLTDKWKCKWCNTLNDSDAIICKKCGDTAR